MALRGKDERGAPVFLAEEAPAAPKNEVDIKPNEPSVDEPAPTPSVPIPSRSQVAAAEGGADEHEIARRWDAVRDAAREFDMLEEGDARDFIAGRALAPESVDVGQFLADVRRVRIDDITDALDHSLRTSGSMITARRRVRVQAPRGWLNRSLNKLSDEEVDGVVHRLSSRGHTKDQAAQNIARRLRGGKRSEEFLARHAE